MHWRLFTPQKPLQTLESLLSYQFSVLEFWSFPWDNYNFTISIVFFSFRWNIGVSFQCDYSCTEPHCDWTPRSVVLPGSVPNKPPNTISPALASSFDHNNPRQHNVFLRSSSTNVLDMVHITASSSPTRRVQQAKTQNLLQQFLHFSTNNQSITTNRYAQSSSGGLIYHTAW